MSSSIFSSIFQELQVHPSLGAGISPNSLLFALYFYYYHVTINICSCGSVHFGYMDIEGAIRVGFKSIWYKMSIVEAMNLYCKVKLRLYFSCWKQF